MALRPIAFGLAVAVAAVLGVGAAGAGDVPVVAAASDLTFALTEIADAYAAETGAQVDLVFGSTGNFAAQIREGAPFDIFLAADESYVLDLAAQGLTRDEGVLYALGRIAIIVPKGGALVADGSLTDLAQAVAAGTAGKIAIANPDHAPYGLRAMQALQHAGLWEAVQPHLVLGENVAQAAQFATSGNAQGAIVAYSLALSGPVSALCDHALIPEDWHAPLRQRMVLLSGADPGAEAFFAYLTGPEARAILDAYGFGLPGE